MSEKLDIQKLADASRVAAKHAGVAEGVANKVLDAICAAGEDGENAFDLWAAIDEQIGKAQAPGLQEQLIELRTRFQEEMFLAEISRLARAFNQGPDAGWKAWLTTLAEAIVRFRLRFSQSLCAHSFPFPESSKQALENLRKAVRCMFQSRWPETYEQLDYLTKLDFLPAVTRAKLCVMAGQIQLYHFVKSARAKEWFDTAERLAPDDFMVLSGRGYYWAAEKDFKKARGYFERAIKVAPGLPSGYTGMGESFENDKDLETARAWYLEAIVAASGDGQGYGKLLKLYGRPEFFKDHEGELQTLMQRALAVSPEDEYQLYIDLGYCYEQNERLGEAQSWYEKAISLDPKRPTGYSTLAQFYEKQGRKDEAEATYKKAIEAAPECYEGYWGLTWLYEQQERWKEALEWYQRAPQHIEVWAGLARARAGEMHWRLQNYSLAEDTLKRELRAHKNSDTAKSVLQTFADDYYKKLKDRESATRVYREILEILGDSYLGDYRNSLGNMSYFYGDYTQAAKEYLAAIAAKPNNPVFRRNLSEAHSQLKNYCQARESLEKAFRIDNDSTILNREMALLVNAEGNDYYAQGDYRRAIERYTQAIEFDASNDVIHSNLGGAWERLREPGKRLEALDKAIEAYESAHDVKAPEKYERDIARLQRKKEYALRYGEKAIDWLHVVTPIAVEVAKELIPLTEGSTGTSLSEHLSKHLTEMKGRVQNEFGLRIPGVRFRGNETDLPPRTYLIMINEIPLVMGTLEPDQRFFPGSAESLATLGVEGKEVNNPLNGEKGSWIQRDNWEKVESAGLELWDVIEYLIRHVESVIQRNLVEFLGHQEVADIVQIECPVSLADLRTSPGKLAALTAVCRGLMAEGVPIKPFREIYKTFDELYLPSASLQRVVESIRSLPALRSRLPGNDSQYGIVPLGSRFEADIRNSIYQNGACSILAMEPESCQSALSAVRSELGLDRNVAVVVEDAQLRPYVRLLLELEFPNNPVLSRRELRTDADFRTAGLVELEERTTLSKPDFSNRKSIEISNNGHEDGRRIALEREIGITVFVNESALGNEAGADDQPIQEMFSMMQDGLFYELGIVLPEVLVEIDDNLKANEFRFNLNGREYDRLQGLKRDEFLVNDVIERLILLNIKARQAFNPANGNECAIIAEAQASVETCRDAGLTTWGPAGFLVLSLSAEIRKNASMFQTLEATHYILESLRVAFPELIAATLKRFSAEQVCLVLKDLLDEEISIRDLRGILESMLSIRGTTDIDLSRYIIFTPQAQSLCPVSGNRGLDDLRISDYSNFVRASLKRYISHKYTRGSNTLIVYLLDPAIEKRIGNVPAQPLTSEESAELKAAVRLEVEALPPTAQNPVLLTTMDVRRAMRQLIEKDFPRLAVLSYQELSPDMNIQPIARISLS